MTTVAWDGSILAGDTFGHTDNLKVHAIKVFALPENRLFGCAGSYSDGLAVRDWLSTMQGEKPKVQDFEGIVIDDHGKSYRLYDSLIHIPIDEPFYAIGSGRDFAIAAMELGKNAGDAVRIAAKFDIYTNDSLTVFTHVTNTCHFLRQYLLSTPDAFEDWLIGLPKHAQKIVQELAQEFPLRSRMTTTGEDILYVVGYKETGDIICTAKDPGHAKDWKPTLYGAARIQFLPAETVREWKHPPLITSQMNGE